MICKDFNFFPSAGLLLGIDWGGRRIGLAVSSPDRGFVFARPRIENTAAAPDKIIEIAKSENAAGIVIGLPLRLDGTESETTARARAFANDLAGKTDIPIILFDESLTSFAAEDAAASRRDAKNLDSESAKIILENAIHFLTRKKNSES
jgi:putative Holliday junction resolvase